MILIMLIMKMITKKRVTCHLIIELTRVLDIFQLFAELLSTQRISKPELAIQLIGQTISEQI